MKTFFVNMKKGQLLPSFYNTFFVCDHGGNVSYRISIKDLEGVNEIFNLYDDRIRDATLMWGNNGSMCAMALKAPKFKPT